MRRRHLGRALVASVVLVTVVGLGAMPASAASAEITGGTADWYHASSDLVDSEDLGATGVECPGSTNGTVVTHTTTTHAWTFQYNIHRKEYRFSQWYTAVSQLSSSGTSSATGTSTGTASRTINLHPIASETSPCSTAVTPCVIAATGINMSAAHTVGPTSLEASDTLSFTGDNGGPNGHGDFGFEDSVTGPATACGSLLWYDDGGIELVGVTVHVTAV